MVEKMKNQELITNKKPLDLQIKNGIKYFPVFVVLCVFAFLLLAPLVWMCLGSFKSDAEVMQYPPKFFPQANHLLENWKTVMTRIDFLTLTKNTVIYAVGCTIPSMFINALAGYAFARFNFKGKNLLFLLFLATMMIPFQVIMVPLYSQLFHMKLLNTYLGLILPRATNAFGIFMMRQFFVTLPGGLEEAARIDGANAFQIYVRIMLPLCKPAMVTLTIFHAMYNWNDLLYPLILATKPEMKTLAAGLASFMGTHVVEYGIIMAGAVLSLLPIFIAYCLAQKAFVQGIAMTGMKG